MRRWPFTRENTSSNLTEKVDADSGPFAGRERELQSSHPSSLKKEAKVFCFVLFCFVFVRAASVPYGGPQARGRTGAGAAGHSNAVSELLL